jgi:(p)ppGpp synthase/HD superfamily hydrolase
MPTVGVQGATASGLKATGNALPGPGPEELTAVLGYLKPADVEAIERAYEMARAAHSGQYRQSGEPYITHPLAVAKILAEWHLDPQALMAALLHDTVEDTHTTKAEISTRFGKAVGEL